MTRIARLSALLCPFLLSVAACSSSEETPAIVGTDAGPIPDTGTLADGELAPDPVPASSAVLTTEVTWAPTHAIESGKGPNPSIPSALETYLSEGYGERTKKGGEPYVARAPDAETPPAPGPGAKRLLRFVHLADLQLVDDEAATRTGTLDTTGATSSALRPQDAEICRMSNAAVRTINALHRKEPIEFVLMGGDNIDNAQSNELDWFLGIMQGGVKVECDSGEDDDLIPGPGNDGKDAFVSEGLLMPWKWVTGNHDVLVQGNFSIDGYKDIAVGDYTGNGTRDYRLGGDIVAGVQIIADKRRAVLDRTTLMARVSGNDDGHGTGVEQKASGKAHYHFDVPNTPLRFVIIDTASELGGAEGVIRKGEIDKYIVPALDEAKALGKWVILASHHAQGSLSLDGGAFGIEPPDAMEPAAWANLIGSYPNVLYSIVAHSHQHRVNRIVPTVGHAWWEVMTSAIADFPHEFRILEIFDQDNGWVMLRATCVDVATDADPVVQRGLLLGTVDLTSGWNPGDGRGAADARNVEVWAKKP